LLGKINAFLYLFSQARGFSTKWKLFRTLLLAQLMSSRRPKDEIVNLRFKNFDLQFQVGQGELTPYREVADAIAAIRPRLGPTSGKILIDGGANIGLFSMFCRDAERIVAIEPNPLVNRRLAENFRLNNVRGEVVQKALSSEEKQIKMDLREGATVLSTVSADGNTVVEATTIDRLIEHYQLPRVDLLKLDVEGHELEALAGAAKSLQGHVIHRLFVEYVGQEKLDALDRLLTGSGYKRTVTLDYNALYESALD
jgi:FkbM family methyltransferase